jgi:hypothetical protein
MPEISAAVSLKACGVLLLLLLLLLLDAVQVVGVHPQGYLICQVMLPDKVRLPMHCNMATVAVPLSDCPPSMRLGSPQQQQGGAVSDGDSFSRMNMYQEETQARWEPWDLHKAAAAAASDAAGDMQAWRQGVLGLWRQPHLQVKLQLLPLEQQQDQDALLVMGAVLERWRGVDTGADLLTMLLALQPDRLNRRVQESWAGLEAGRGKLKPHSSFGDARNLLLLGRIVDEVPKASD